MESNLEARKEESWTELPNGTTNGHAVHTNGTALSSIMSDPTDPFQDDESTDEDSTIQAGSQSFTERIEDDQKTVRQSRPRKTPWQLLWDDLADFAGIRDAEDSDEDS